MRCLGRIGFFTGMILILLWVMPGCSTAGDVTSLPVEDGTLESAVSQGPEHSLLGMWDLFFEPVEGSVEIVRLRNVGFHADLTPMIIPPACGNCVVVVTISGDAPKGWVRVWGGPSGMYGENVATGYKDNVFVASKFWGTIDFDPGPAVDEHTSQGGADICLSKFPPGGDW